MKLDLAVIVASIAGAALWVEHSHRIDIATSAGYPAPVAEVCPDNENMPYSRDCIRFMQGDDATDVHVHVMPIKHIATAVADATTPGCLANNENRPYSTACLRYMSGWFWQAN